MRPMNWRVIALYLLGYVFLDWVSYLHPVLPLGMTPWNPPPSVSLFLLLRFGLRYWPWLFVASLAADVVVRGVPAPWPVLWLAALLVTVIYSLSGAVLRRLLPPPRPFGTARELALFLLVVVPATFLVAAGYVGLFTVSGEVPTAEFVPDLFRHWIGDLNGILVFAPVLLVYAGKRRIGRRWTRRMTLEIAAQALGIVLALWLVFGPVSSDEFTFFYVLFLPLTWISVRWGIQGAAPALLAIQLGLIAAVEVGGYPAAAFVLFQYLMLALCVTGLALGALVTHRLQVEAELRAKQNALNHALQFAAAGEMTSALAHELNQPLAALANYLSACEMLVEAGGDRELLEATMAKAIEQTRRAGTVVQRLREFFLRGALSREDVSVLRLIAEAVESVRARAEQANVDVRTHIAPHMPQLSADPMQISMVLHNLFANAIDEIVLAGSAVREIIVEAGYDGDWITILIADSGRGISAEAANSVFEPFVTHKPEGMGLGLAISRSMVRAHGGELALAPALTGGARFVLTLPLCSEKIRE